eukprot:2710355-Alexandrium_andersonii.AAC.1
MFFCPEDARVMRGARRQKSSFRSPLHDCPQRSRERGVCAERLASRREGFGIYTGRRSRLPGCAVPTRGPGP